MTKADKSKPPEFIPVADSKLRIAGLGSCCYQSLRLYMAQGGNTKPGATHECLGCGSTMVANKSYWEKKA